MKYIKLLLLLFLLQSCSVEQRIKEHSYTNEWYIEDSIKYQVYKTRTCKKYILILNKNNTRYKRRYLTREEQTIISSKKIKRKKSKIYYCYNFKEEEI